MERSAVTAFAALAVRPHNALGRGQLPGRAPALDCAENPAGHFDVSYHNGCGVAPSTCHGDHPPEIHPAVGIDGVNSVRRVDGDFGCSAFAVRPDLDYMARLAMKSCGGLRPWVFHPELPLSIIDVSVGGKHGTNR